MNPVSQQTSMDKGIAPQLPGSTRIDYARFLVSDVSKSLGFYKDLVGLTETSSRGNTMALASTTGEPPLVLLTEDPNARQRPVRSAGLFHLALLYHTRRDLASAFMRLHEHGWQFQGFADHGVSEALYLADADGNGIELYADRPHTEWPYKNGELEMTTKPLNLDSLLSELEGPPQQQSGSPLTIGHIHLQVTNLQTAKDFYHKTLGFEITQQSFPGALFVAAGGYHHHIGLNIWNSRNGSPSREGTAGLVRFGIRVGSADALQALAARFSESSYRSKESERGIVVNDPDNIEIELL